VGGRLAVMIVVLSALALAPAAEAKRPSCYGHGWMTVVQSPKVRIFYKYAPDGAIGAYYYGCLRRTGKRTFLTDSSTEQVYSNGPSIFRLHGALVAWAESSCGSDDCNTAAFTVDLRSRKPIRSFVESRQDVDSAITDLKLAASGSFGVVQVDTSNTDRSTPPIYDIIGVTAAGSTLLDSGEDIDASSLAIGGPWLYWTRAGQPHSAQLP
jgi:hypothetical protein